MMPLAGALLLVLLGSACGGSGGPDGGTGTDMRVLRRPDMATATWATETVAEVDVGFQMDMAQLPAGGLMVAWLATQARNEGPCTELGDEDLPDRFVYDLEVLEVGINGGVQGREVVQEQLSVGEPTGIDLEVDGAGRPVIATRFGEPSVDFGWCGVHDLGLLIREGRTWREETLVRTSGEAASGEPGSDFGEIVGWWPGLAFGPGGRSVVGYRDVHAGGRQSDDIRRADFEVAFDTGGGYEAIPVEVGNGAGSYNRAAFTSDGTAYLVYVNTVESATEVQRGIWVARSADGEAWARVRIAASPTTNGPAIAVDPIDDTLRVAWYDTSLGQVQLVTLTDPGAFESFADGWTRETVGDPRFDEGRDPSLAVAADGTVGIAYRRCSRVGEGDCTPREDAVVFAYSAFGGPWTVEVVDEGEDGDCGLYPSLVMAAEGPRIAYLCVADVAGSAEDTVRVARRGPP
ncbi:MAG: hypothetical protein ACFCGT_03270 [Sandaracinaceae bacterium]